MHPLRPLTRPARHLGRALWLPLKAIFVIGLCAGINLLTSPDHLWFQWVALGMGIAVVVAWVKALRTLGAVAAVALFGAWLARRSGLTAAAPRSGA